MRIGRPTFDRFCFVVVDAQRQAERGEEVGRVGRPLLDRRAVAAGLADRLAALDAAAGQHGAPGVREVVAALLLVDLRRAAELAHPDDQGRVEQAALLQVVHQRAQAGVERAAQVLDRVEVVGRACPSCPA